MLLSSPSVKSELFSTENCQKTLESFDFRVFLFFLFRHIFEEFRPSKMGDKGLQGHNFVEMGYKMGDRMGDKGLQGQILKCPLF